MSIVDRRAEVPDLDDDITVLALCIMCGQATPHTIATGRYLSRWVYGLYCVTCGTVLFMTPVPWQEVARLDAEELEQAEAEEGGYDG